MMGEYNYRLSNGSRFFDIISINYSQLIKEDENGNDTILYDVKAEQIFRTIVFAVFIIIFVLIVGIMLLKSIKTISITQPK